MDLSARTSTYGKTNSNSNTPTLMNKTTDECTNVMLLFQACALARVRRTKKFTKLTSAVVPKSFTRVCTYCTVQGLGKLVQLYNTELIKLIIRTALALPLDPYIPTVLGSDCTVQDTDN